MRAMFVQSRTRKKIKRVNDFAKGANASRVTHVHVHTSLNMFTPLVVSYRDICRTCFFFLNRKEAASTFAD